MSDVDTALSLAEAMWATRAPASKAIDMLDAAIAQAPPERLAYARALRARASLLAGNAAEAKRFVALAEDGLDADDVAAHKLLGSLLLYQVQSMPDDDAMMSTDSVQMLERAHRHFEATRNKAPDDIEACWGYSTTAILADGDVEDAVATLETCYERAPRSAEINLALSMGNGRLGNLQAMRDHMVYAVHYSRDAASRAWAMRNLSSIDERLKEKGLLQE